jgi:hypothetical protein
LTSAFIQNLAEVLLVLYLIFSDLNRKKYVYCMQYTADGGARTAGAVFTIRRRTAAEIGPQSLKGVFPIFSSAYPRPSGRIAFFSPHKFTLGAGTLYNINHKNWAGGFSTRRPIPPGRALKPEPAELRRGFERRGAASGLSAY